MERFEPFVLGQCPFCNGGATAAVRRFDERTIGMWYVAFDYDLRPGCPNGCPIDRFDMTRLFFDGWTVASDYDPTPAFRRAWMRDVRMFHNRPPARGADGPHGCASAPISPWAARGADCGRSRSAATGRRPSWTLSRRGTVLRGRARDRRPAPRILPQGRRAGSCDGPVPQGDADGPAGAHADRSRMTGVIRRHPGRHVRVRPM